MIRYRPYTDFISEVKKRAERNKNRKDKSPSEKIRAQQWEDLRARFDKYITGIDRNYINIHPTGFSVRIHMKTAPIEERKSYVEKNRKDILIWCTGKIAEVRGFMRKIGDLSYYTPTEIVVLQSGEMEVFYEVKKMPPLTD